jgi:hypothetical protein
VKDRNHLGDDAALYALGVLDESTRSAVDSHAAGCAPCRRLLGAAEEDVTRMVAAEPSHEPPAALLRRFRAPSPPLRAGWAAWGALAAALLLAILPSAYFWKQNQAMHVTLAANTSAMSRLAETSVRSATFTTMTGGASARVMYPPDGSWYVVLVHGASRALDVVWMHDGTRTMLGRAQPYGDVAMLYLPKSHRMNQLALVEGPRLVAEAQLAYESK